MSTDETPDERQRRKAAQAIQRLKDQHVTDSLTALCAKENGRAFLNWLLEITGAVGRTPFTQNALATSFNCGEQNIGLKILARILEVAPEGYITMLKESEQWQMKKQLEVLKASQNQS